jgi:hypothetical protein
VRALLQTALRVPEAEKVNGPHVNGCTGKKKFSTRALAEEVARPRGGRRFTMNVYQCRACHCWHLTSWTPEQQERAVARTKWRQEHARPLGERVARPMPGADLPDEDGA